MIGEKLGLRTHSSSFILSFTTRKAGFRILNLQGQEPSTSKHVAATKSNFAFRQQRILGIEQVQMDWRCPKTRMSKRHQRPEF